MSLLSVVLLTTGVAIGVVLTIFIVCWRFL